MRDIVDDKDCKKQAILATEKLGLPDCLYVTTYSSGVLILIISCLFIGGREREGGVGSWRS